LVGDAFFCSPCLKVFEVATGYADVEPLIFFEGGLSSCMMRLGAFRSVGHGLELARLKGLLNLELFVVVVDFLGHGLLLNCRVALRLGMKVYRKNLCFSSVGVHLPQLLHSSRLGIAQHQGGDLIDAPMPRVALGAVLELDVDVLLLDGHGFSLGFDFLAPSARAASSGILLKNPNTWSNFVVYRACRNTHIKLGLKIHPKAWIHAKKQSQSESSIGGDRAFAVNQFADAAWGHVNIGRNLAGSNAHGLHKVL
jgi:hypothetical protein